MTTLSIIVPITLMAGRLSRLESWLKLCDSENIEVILVHDYRDESTEHEINQMIKNYDACKGISGYFGSVGLARNAGLEKSNGEWIMFADSDDEVYVHEVLSTLLESNSETRIICASYNETSNRTLTTTLKDASHLSKIAITLKPGIWRFLIRKELLSDAKFEDFAMAEDQLFLLENGIFERIDEFSNRIIYNYYLDDPLQATANVSKIDDLKRSIQHLSRIEKHFYIEKINLVDLMILSQTVTLLKRGSLKGKTYGCYKFICNPVNFWRLILVYKKNRYST
jgi:glycosyltransferase involved in cell wall biosynthesis